MADRAGDICAGSCVKRGKNEEGLSLRYKQEGRWETKTTEWKQRSSVGVSFTITALLGWGGSEWDGDGEEYTMSSSTPPPPKGHHWGIGEGEGEGMKDGRKD